MLEYRFGEEIQLNLDVQWVGGRAGALVVSQI